MKYGRALAQRRARACETQAGWLALGVSTVFSSVESTVGRDGDGLSSIRIPMMGGAEARTAGSRCGLRRSAIKE